MSNQKITELRQLSSVDVAAGDLLPIVDVSDMTISPTGETKKITTQNLTSWMASSGILDLQTPYRATQTSNGLYFDPSVAPNGNQNLYCYTPFSTLGNAFSIYTRAFVPSTRVGVGGLHRILFGVGDTYSSVVQSGNSAYIAVVDDDLIAYVNDTYTNVTLTVSNFFLNNKDRVFGACLTKDGANLKFVVNGEYVASSSSGPSNPINNTYLVMGNGHATANNMECIVYEAQVFSSALTTTGSAQLFFGGAYNAHQTLIASYTSDNLFAGPSQWLDSKGNKHLLIPTSGASATNPSKKFNLNFYCTSSGFLGNGTVRNVLPEKYIITSCVVETDFKPLIAVGTTSSISPVSASGTGSWWDNRVPFTSASYGVNPLGILALGAAHSDRSLYVAYSGSLLTAPCTFSFEGFVRI